MTKELGAGATATPSGSREPSPSGLGPSGFDPSRWQALREGDSFDFYGCAEPRCPHCGEHVSVARHEFWELYSDDETHAVECPYCEHGFNVFTRCSYSFSTDEQDDMLDEEAAASAIEAQRAGTPQSGPVHESAVGNAETPNPSLRTITSQGGTR